MMTIDEVRALSDEELQLKVALYDGFTDPFGPLHQNRDGRLYGWQVHQGYRTFFKPIPEYANDLNAMHSAVSKLDWTILNEWLYNLGQILGYHNRNEWEWCALVNATAKQRAQAFLLMMENKNG